MSNDFSGIKFGGLANLPGWGRPSAPGTPSAATYSPMSVKIDVNNVEREAADSPLLSSGDSKKESSSPEKTPETSQTPEGLQGLKISGLKGLSGWGKPANISPSLPPSVSIAKADTPPTRNLSDSDKLLSESRKYMEKIESLDPKHTTDNNLSLPSVVVPSKSTSELGFAAIFGKSNQISIPGIVTEQSYQFASDEKKPDRKQRNNMLPVYEVRTQGLARSGQLGQQMVTSDTRYSLEKVSGFKGKKIRQVSCGAEFSACVTYEEGDLYVWGKGNRGQLGVGDECDVLCPILVATNIELVACHTYHMLALDFSGAVYSWGAGEHGRLGHGDVTDQNTPTRIDELKDANIVRIAAGLEHSAAVSGSGKVYVWGNGENGRLGVGHEQNVYTPTVVTSLSAHIVIDVALGDNFSLFLTSEGDVFSCGSGSLGELGFPGYNLAVPWKIQGLSNVMSIAAGAHHGLAVLGDGTAWAWGLNAKGQLGLCMDCRRKLKQMSKIPSGKIGEAINQKYGPTGSEEKPVEIPLERSNDIGISAVLKGKDEIIDYVSRPCPIKGIEKAIFATAFANHSAAVTSVGVLTWGENSEGCLGHSTKLTVISEPRRVPKWSNKLAYQIAFGSDHAVIGTDNSAKNSKKMGISYWRRSKVLSNVVSRLIYTERGTRESSPDVSESSINDRTFLFKASDSLRRINDSAEIAPAGQIPSTRDHIQLNCEYSGIGKLIIVPKKATVDAVREKASRAFRKTVRMNHEVKQSDGALCFKEWTVSSVEGILSRPDQKSAIVLCYEIGDNCEDQIRLCSSADLRKGHNCAVTVVKPGTGKYQKNIFTGDIAGVIRGWTIAWGRCSHVLRAHSDAVTAIELEDHRDRLFSASDDRSVRWWNLLSMENVISVQNPGRVTSLRLFESSLFISDDVGNIEVLNKETGELMNELHGIGNVKINKTLLSGSRFYAGGGNNVSGVIGFWNVQKGQEAVSLCQGHTEAVIDMVLLKTMLISLSGDKTIRVWNPDVGVCRTIIPIHGAGLVIHAIENVVYVGMIDGRILGFNTDLINDRSTNQSPDIEFHGHKDQINCLTSIDHILISGAGYHGKDRENRDSTIRIWNTQTGTCAKTLVGHVGAITSLYLPKEGKLADKNFLLSGSADNTCCSWPLQRILKENSEEMKIENSENVENPMITTRSSKTTKKASKEEEEVSRKDYKLLFSSFRDQLRYIYVPSARPPIDYIKFLFDFMQLASFPFLFGFPWPESLSYLRSIFNFFTISIEMPVSISSYVSLAFCLFFTLCFYTAPYIKFQYRRHQNEVTNSKVWRNLWLSVWAFMMISSTVAVLPTVGLAAASIPCRNGYMTASVTVVCYSTQHFINIACTMPILILYVPMCVRLAGVDGDIGRIKPFKLNWKVDSPDLENIHHTSVQSFLFHRVLVLTKIICGLIALIGTDPIPIRLTQMIQATVLIFTSISLLAVLILKSPYYNKIPNSVRFATFSAVLMTNGFGVIVVALNDTKKEIITYSYAGAAILIMIAAYFLFPKMARKPGKNEPKALRKLRKAMSIVRPFASATSISLTEYTRTAVNESYEKLLADLDGKSPDFLLVAGTGDHNHEVIRSELARLTPSKTNIHGVSSIDDLLYGTEASHEQEQDKFETDGTSKAQKHILALFGVVDTFGSYETGIVEIDCGKEGTRKAGKKAVLSVAANMLRSCVNRDLTKQEIEESVAGLPPPQAIIVNTFHCQSVNEELIDGITSLWKDKSQIIVVGGAAKDSIQDSTDTKHVTKKKKEFSLDLDDFHNDYNSEKSEAKGWFITRHNTASKNHIILTLLYPSVEVSSNFEGGFVPTPYVGRVSATEDGRVIKIDGEIAETVVHDWQRRFNQLNQQGLSRSVSVERRRSMSSNNPSSQYRNSLKPSVSGIRGLPWLRENAAEKPRAMSLAGSRSIQKNLPVASQKNLSLTETVEPPIFAVGKLQGRDESDTSYFSVCSAAKCPGNESSEFKGIEFGGQTLVGNEVTLLRSQLDDLVMGPAITARKLITRTDKFGFNSIGGAVVFWSAEMAKILSEERGIKMRQKLSEVLNSTNIVGPCGVSQIGQYLNGEVGQGNMMTSILLFSNVARSPRFDKKKFVKSMEK